jgi:hypothetical protein
MNDLLALSDLEDLTPVQRRAHLAYWYMSEVYNGGHWQYFCNKADYDHDEVVDSLRAIGATAQAEILERALVKLPEDMRLPETAEEFIEGYDESDLEDLDTAFYDCETTIEDRLETYLDDHESEFIEWIP